MQLRRWPAQKFCPAFPFHGTVLLMGRTETEVHAQAGLTRLSTLSLTQCRESSWTVDANDPPLRPKRTHLPKRGARLQCAPLQGESCLGIQTVKRSGCIAKICAIAYEVHRTPCEQERRWQKKPVESANAKRRAGHVGSGAAD